MRRVNGRPLTDTQDRLFSGDLFFFDIIGGDSRIGKGVICTLYRIAYYQLRKAFSRSCFSTPRRLHVRERVLARLPMHEHKSPWPWDMPGSPCSGTS